MGVLMIERESCCAEVCEPKVVSELAVAERERSLFLARYTVIVSRTVMMLDMLYKIDFFL